MVGLPARGKTYISQKGLTANQIKKSYFCLSLKQFADISHG
jgi:hypothetical protein